MQEVAPVEVPHLHEGLSEFVIDAGAPTAPAHPMPTISANLNSSVEAATTEAPMVQIRTKRKYADVCIGTAIYLFAGPKRKSTIANVLRRLNWIVTEIDILQERDKHDLTNKGVQERILSQLSSPGFDLMLTSPPCDTFTRVKYSNRWGPRPTRTSVFRRGMPNLTQAEIHRNKLANALVDFSYTAILKHLERPSALLGLEFPEDLGVITKGEWTGTRPSSIFQWPEFDEVVSVPGVVTGGIRQADFGTPYVKPTRLILKAGRGLSLRNFFPGKPIFSSKGLYLGPIPPEEGYSSQTEQAGKLSHLQYRSMAGRALRRTGLFVY